MSNSKEIRSRIKSINNTGKITRAMEMVSAAKMRKSTESVLKIREYAHSAWSVLTNLARSFEDYNHGMLEVRPVRNVLIVVVTSNRGLCGSFNSQIMKKVKEEINNPDKLKINRIGAKRIESNVKNEDLKIDFITVGKKGEGLVRKLGKDIVAAFPDLTYLPKIEQVRPLSKIVMDEYLNKKYDKVVMAYTDYVSVITQQPKVRQLLPISKIDLEKQIAEMDNLAKEYGLEKPKSEYKVEPTPDEVLTHIFPRLIEMQLYHAILESNASKESARMMAMRSATDAAKDMSEGLNLAYNKIRQMKITQEIAEISAGRAALE
ncbi:MAG: FoF1 ATP synthase subunit gamma [Candidatus Moranbacteria bacterium]|jgi:F-type H+-transporting ATPase subunit gamma|nr:FoF1 ATP synthase subunit gamma [Candidatus Moranbacteria bacterium]